MEKLFENVLNESNDYNDAYSHTPTKFSLQTIKNFFNSPKDLAEYIYDHKQFLNTSCMTDLYSAKYVYDKGFEAFYEEAYQPLKDSIKTLNNFINNDFVILYRGLVIVDNDEINLEHPGVCWTYDVNYAKEFAKDLCINEEGFKETVVILKAKVPVEKIDWLCSALLLADEPDEKEIRLWDDSNLEVSILK